jgi:hypothetical protein
MSRAIRYAANDRNNLFPECVRAHVGLAPRQHNDRLHRSQPAMRQNTKTFVISEI